MDPINEAYQKINEATGIIEMDGQAMDKYEYQYDGDSGNILTNLSKQYLQKYLNKKWDTPNPVELKKVDGKTHKGIVTVLVIDSSNTKSTK